MEKEYVVKDKDWN